MRANAEDAETLDRVKDVTGRHLERFGEKDGLSVTWQLARRSPAALRLDDDLAS